MKFLSVFISISFFMTYAHADKKQCTEIIDKAMAEKHLGTFNKPTQFKDTKKYSYDKEVKTAWMKYAMSHKDVVAKLNLCFNEKASTQEDIESFLPQYSFSKALNDKLAKSHYKEHAPAFSQDEKNEIAFRNLGSTCDERAELGEDNSKYFDDFYSKYFYGQYKNPLVAEAMHAAKDMEITTLDKKGDFIVVSSAGQIESFAVLQDNVPSFYYLDDNCGVEVPGVSESVQSYCQNKEKFDFLCDKSNDKYWATVQRRTDDISEVDDTPTGR